MVAIAGIPVYMQIAHVHLQVGRTFWVTHIKHTGS